MRLLVFNPFHGQPIGAVDITWKFLEKLTNVARSVRAIERVDEEFGYYEPGYKLLGAGKEVEHGWPYIPFDFSTTVSTISSNSSGLWAMISARCPVICFSTKKCISSACAEIRIVEKELALKPTL